MLVGVAKLFGSLRGQLGIASTIPDDAIASDAVVNMAAAAESS